MAFALPSATQAAGPVYPTNMKIMPLGDSITLGNSNAGYRGPLYNLLNAAAPGVQYVGASSLNPGSLPAGNQQHNGYASYATLDLSNNLDGLDTTRYTQQSNSEISNPNGGYWLTGGNGTGRGAVYPDAVLLMVGTNDIYQGTLGNTQINVPSFQTNLNTLVNKIVTMRPDAHLILADITPWTGHSADVATVNNVVNVVAAQYQAQGKHVSRVDLNTGFPVNGSDGLHPNDVGYAWMANKWYGAIQSSFTPTPEPSTLVLLAMGLLSLLAYAWRKRK